MDNPIKEMQLKEINELAREASRLQDMVQELFPRDEKLWASVEKAAKNRFTGMAVMFKKYDETVKGTFDERVALMLLQVLEIAHKNNVDLKFMIQSISNYRTSCILNGKMKSTESQPELKDSEESRPRKKK